MIYRDFKAEAIVNLYPSIAGIDGNYVPRDSNNNQVTIDEAAVQAEITRLQAEYAAKQYQRDRAAAYPSIPDQLDLLYHQGYDGWKAAIDQIKQEYPKP